MRVKETKSKGEVTKKVKCPICDQKHEYTVIGKGTQIVVCLTNARRRFQIVI
jgi:hypothetical protein